MRTDFSDKLSQPPILVSNLLLLGVKMKSLINQEIPMLDATLSLCAMLLIAALLGVIGLAGTAAGMGKVLFVLFLMMFIISFVIPRIRPPA